MVMKFKLVSFVTTCQILRAKALRYPMNVDSYFQFDWIARLAEIKHSGREWIEAYRRLKYSRSSHQIRQLFSSYWFGKLNQWNDYMSSFCAKRFNSKNFDSQSSLYACSLAHVTNVDSNKQIKPHIQHFNSIAHKLFAQKLKK